MRVTLLIVVLIYFYYYSDDNSNNKYKTELKEIINTKCTDFSISHIQNKNLYDCLKSNTDVNKCNKIEEFYQFNYRRIYCIERESNNIYTPLIYIIFPFIVLLFITYYILKLSTMVIVVR